MPDTTIPLADGDLQFKTYDSAWNRTGYADRLQYTGQAGQTYDFPAECPTCGAHNPVSYRRGPNSPEMICQNGHAYYEIKIPASLCVIAAKEMM
jgi:hypothetical protein